MGIAAFGHRSRILNAVKTLIQPSQTTKIPTTLPSKSILDLAVLHAAPLVIKDAKGHLYSMEKLDLEAERRAITNSLLADVRDRAIHVQFEVATTDILRRIMTTTTCRVSSTV